MVSKGVKIAHLSIQVLHGGGKPREQEPCQERRQLWPLQGSWILPAAWRPGRSLCWGCWLGRLSQSWRGCWCCVLPWRTSSQENRPRLSRVNTSSTRTPKPALWSWRFLFSFLQLDFLLLKWELYHPPPCCSRLAVRIAQPAWGKASGLGNLCCHVNSQPWEHFFILYQQRLELLPWLYNE